ncbi:MAG TPA: glycosyltransferase [Rhizomicrobium sp.]|jgi:glycosyltransferase involved in cell wall biosynthesis/GT2 family glycosyltransferase|nr:glycosyltransferase [Rhizomicrobium sp.]
MKVTVLDMQPIEPAIGGGRLRLLGLYHGLGPATSTLYVGTYDWPGPGYRRQKLSPTLEELLIPLSPGHFKAADERARLAGGRVIIDSTFAEMAHLSPDYVAAARNAAAEADVVVFSHPWIYPLVREMLDPARQLIVYDAHNMEALLRMELLDDGRAGTEIVRDVIRVEFELCHAAHLLLACSHEDRVAFNRFYGLAYERMRVIPNGTFTEKIRPATPGQKASARQELNLDSAPVAFFIGSNYHPNAEAVAFIAGVLAPALPHMLFVVAGGVGEGFANRPKPFNLHVTGYVDDDERQRWLHAADIAVNPMFGGSGTNIKMLDYMAAGLPVVTTPVGARGIDVSEEAFAVADPAQFATAVDTVLTNPARAAALAGAARQQIRTLYSWERISRNLGHLLRRHHSRLDKRRPFFSVVVPSFERHGQLTLLMENIGRQTYSDFEVIVVDQSGSQWPDREIPWTMDLLYLHTDVRGPGFARNTGAMMARGRVIAFIDDDCEPFRDWLEGARGHFSEPGIVGVEGLILSDRAGDPEWRAVTNEGFEGVGFMTANLFVRAEVFHAINGFDIAFGDLPFREDTDLGWRAQELGTIVFSRAARVYHPPQPRSLERESLEARSHFFERDALLLHKHPGKYAELMRRERQWLQNPYFWPHFLAGTRRYRVKLPDNVRNMIPWNIRPKADSA